MKFLPLLTLTTFFCIHTVNLRAQTTPISFGDAQSFSVLAHETVTNTGNTVVSCNVGVSPGSSITAFNYDKGIAIDGRSLYGSFFRKENSLAGAAQKSAHELYKTLWDGNDDNTTELTTISLGTAHITGTLKPGTYTYRSSVLIGGVLTLDDGDDPNAIFIFKIGSTLTTETSTTIKMKSGGTGRNVFWLVGSSATIETYNKMVGNIIALTGISIKTLSTISGKLIALNEAVTMDHNTVSDNSCYKILPITYQSFTAISNNKNTTLTWSTSSEINNSYFTIQSSTDGTNWDIDGNVNGAINSSIITKYTFNAPLSNSPVTYYRLKQTDVNGASLFSNIIILKNTGANINTNAAVSIYPNPSSGKFNLFYSGDKSKIKLIEVFNAQGQKVVEALSFQSKFDLSNKLPGIYYIRLHLTSSAVEHATFVKTN